MPTITIRPFIASADEIGVEVRPADELEHDIRAALRLRPRDELPGSITVAPSAATCSRSPASRTVASTRAPAMAAICTAAVPTPPLAPLTSRSSPGRNPAWLMIASWAVTKTSGTAAAASSSRLSGTASHVQLVDEHPAREPAAADEAEDAVSRRDRERGRPARDHGAGHLEAGHVGRRPGRGGVATLALRQVGRVQRRVADRDEDVVARRHRVGSLLEPDDLVAAGRGEDDRVHARRRAYATPLQGRR